MTTAENRPAPFVTIWAEDGLKFATIPELKSDRDKPIDDKGTRLQPGRATIAEGFPEITMKSVMRGGVPPWGQDHNKILNKITDAIQWMQAGGCAFFNQELCNKIGGYPKGALLQGGKNVQNQNNEYLELPLLWFSIIDANMSDPNTTTSPDNNWVQLDFADLEARLKAAENSIVDIYNNKFPAKADLHGSCSIPFHAETMKASQYRFCNESAGLGGYITQQDKIMSFYPEEKIAFQIENFQNNSLPEDSVPIDSMLALRGDSDGTACYFSADSSIFNSNWTVVRGVFSVSDNLMQMNVGVSGQRKKVTWQFLVDINNDYITQVFTPSEQSKASENLRLGYESGDVTAKGGFISKTGSFISKAGADLAEYYQADRQDYALGTLMCHGVKTEVTMYKNFDQADDYFGVISSNPGYVMNGAGKDDSNAVLIALNGKVPVKVKGVVKCGDKITVGQDGYGVVSTNKNDVIVGRAKEDKVIEEVGLVSCYVQAYC